MTHAWHRKSVDVLTEVLSAFLPPRNLFLSRRPLKTSGHSRCRSTVGLCLKAEEYNRVGGQKQKINSRDTNLTCFVVCVTQWIFDYGGSRWCDCGHTNSAIVSKSRQATSYQCYLHRENNNKQKQTNKQNPIKKYNVKKHFHKSQNTFTEKEKTNSDYKHRVNILQLRGCLHDIGATFTPARVHSGSLL